MEWSCKYGADNKPNQQQIINFVRSSLWETLNNHLHQSYMTEPKYNYSNCSMQPGWNVKYSKNGKSLCRLYPIEGYFIVLVVIGRKEMPEAEFLIPFLSEYAQKVFRETRVGQGAKWLMLDVQNFNTVLDIMKLLALRVKPKINIEMESQYVQNIQNHLEATTRNERFVYSQDN